MRTNRLLPAIGLSAVAALFSACEETDPFVPGGVGAVFRVAWPSATATVEDSETFAVAIYPPAQGGTGNITFTASVDNGPSINGLRNEADSIIAFLLTDLTNGSHTIIVRASTGQVANRTFNVSIVPRPTIEDVVPDSAVIGANQLVTITGQNFIANAQRMRVYLNGTQLPIAGIPTTTQVRATVQGSGPFRSGLISVQADRRTSRELERFRIFGGTPVPPGQGQIFLADPSIAPRSASVVIYGKTFEGGDTPFFGSLASSPIIPLGSENLGQPIGLVEKGLTIVPGLAPSQDTFLSVFTDAGNSTPFPFFID